MAPLGRLSPMIHVALSRQCVGLVHMHTEAAACTCQSECSVAVWHMLQCSTALWHTLLSAVLAVHCECWHALTVNERFSENVPADGLHCAQMGQSLRVGNSECNISTRGSRTARCAEPILNPNPPSGCALWRGWHYTLGSRRGAVV